MSARKAASTEIFKMMCPTHDELFKSLCEWQDIIISFLNSLFAGEYTIIKAEKIANSSLNIKLKEIISDVRFLCTAVYNGHQEKFKAVIEMQRKGDMQYPARVQFYSALIYSCDMEKGDDDYGKILKLKIISIVFNSSSSMLSNAAVHRVRQNVVYTLNGEEYVTQLPHQEQRIEHIYVLLDKGVKGCDMKEELKEWISFFNIERRKEVRKKDKTLILPGGRPSFNCDAINQAVDRMARLVVRKTDVLARQLAEETQKTLEEKENADLVDKQADADDGKAADADEEADVADKEADVAGKRATVAHDKADVIHQGAQSEEEMSKSDKAKNKKLRKKLEQCESWVTKLQDSHHKRKRKS